MKLPKQTVAQRFHIRFFGGLIILLVLLIASNNFLKLDFGALIQNFDQFLALFKEMMHPDWKSAPFVVQPMLETIQMALIGTTLGTLLAIPAAIIAARNVVTNKWITGFVRIIFNMIRTLPDLLLAALFVAIVGIGPYAGVLTLTIFSFGMITKLFYECIETIDNGPLEAILTTGGKRSAMVMFAILPQVSSRFISYILYTFEINVRASTVLGYLGAGGIGQQLQTSLSQFRYDQTAVIILAILIMVLAIDGLSNFARERLQ
ncbi:MAG: phosphonate ABC transporter, permease protein PhnE [Furfurilactobacillus sp.]|jgi:phosphonate transport system permease protein|uniref:phosphonate ABC transporter, permease protein PhnE n=1 Tax=Furfurilactobacillus TaxID=2767882 RepID=UPI001EEDDEA3|nr:MULTISPECIES: phosphonate ABC transporter, permease protein PhnE [Furfurilactobacillus]MCF6420002.1 phosphonate ABC transporter, permease protein PhnE [Furfurilactobacillus milii]MCH4012173.1 phosphonate ABC transporter, permease protein PhnE [Furfurilactobacillus sp.]MCH4038065.1 phosphonate ABC transporter, permease protein PhnE [Furfurilactobacillus sp.]MCH4115298.1 phosphonate ABC transporter, permease protein PhnE [Furfurilactobacillus sp.]MCI1339992.1 phosphonate ABC transporter, perm